MEIGVMLDSSSSVTIPNWSKSIEFLIALSNNFVVSPTQAHFGILHYSTMPTLDFAISDKTYWSAVEFQRKVKEIAYTTGLILLILNFFQWVYFSFHECLVGGLSLFFGNNK